MRDPKRIKRMLWKLDALWSQSPDLRFGQLIKAIECQYGRTTRGELFYIEDDEMESLIDNTINNGWRQ